MSYLSKNGIWRPSEEPVLPFSARQMRMPTHLPTLGRRQYGITPDMAGGIDPTSLQSYWRLDEASGNRADCAGSNTLSDNNTVTQAAGKLIDAAQFTRANTEWLSIVDNSSLRVGSVDLTIGGWVYLDSLPTVGQTFAFAGKWSSFAIGIREYVIWVQHGGVSPLFQFSVSGTGANKLTVTASTFGTPSTGTWYFVVGQADNAGNTIYISVNNGTQDSTSGATSATNGAPFNLGAYNEGEDSSYMDGRLDGWGLYKRKLTGAELTAWYNGGTGLDLC